MTARNSAAWAGVSRQDIFDVIAVARSADFTNCYSRSSTLLSDLEAHRRGAKLPKAYPTVLSRKLGHDPIYNARRVTHRFQRLLATGPGHMS